MRVVNIYFHDEAYNASDHPHAPAGSAKGGQFVKKEGAAPYDFSVGFKKAEATVRKMNSLANEEGTTVIEKAAALKDLAGQFKSPYAMNYANKLLGWLETENGKPKGSLGKAQAAPGKSTGTAPPSEGEPAKVAKVNIAKPKKMKGFNTTHNKSLEAYYIAKSSDDPDAKAAKLQALYETWNGTKFKTYAQEVAKALGVELKEKGEAPAAKPPEPPAKVPDGELPAPHPDSGAQKKMHEAATGAETSAAQIEAVKAVGAHGPLSTKYKEDLLKALGHSESAEPVPEPTAPKPSKLVSKRPADQKFIALINDKALDSEKVGQEKVSTAIPTFTEASFDVFTSKQRTAIKKYTGDYSSEINLALRKPKEATEQGIAWVNEIDDAFDHDDAKLTEDIVVRRGLNQLANTTAQTIAALENIKAGLEKGLPVKFSQRGFISTSIGSGFNGSIKMKMLLRKGTPGIYAGAISSHPEKELLLRHGQQFRVLEYEEKSDVHYLTLVAEI